MDTPIWFRWLGVRGLELKVCDEILAIDPFFTRPPLWRMWFGRVDPKRELVAEKIRRCNYVLVTHAHWDHVMDVPDVVRNTGAIALGSPNTCRLLAVSGVPQDQIRKIGVGDRLNLGDFRVEVLPAQHMRIPGFSPRPLPPNLKPPLRLQDYHMDTCFSFLIEVDGLRILDWCSVRAEPVPPADVLCVGLEGEPSFYQFLLRSVQPSLIIPVHWDNFLRPLSKPIQPFFRPPTWSLPPLGRMNPTFFKEMFERVLPETQVLIPEIFRAYDLQKFTKI